MKKIKENRLFNKWIARRQSGKTNADKLKDHILAASESLLGDLKTDIETGIEEGIYEKADNVHLLKWIGKVEKAIEAFTKFTPTLYIHVEGGNIQGISADSSVAVNVFDVDNFNNGTEEDRDAFVRNFGTPADWNAMIQTRTARKELKAVY